MNQPRVRSRFVRRSNAFHRAEVSKFFASLAASRVDVSGRRARTTVPPTRAAARDENPLSKERDPLCVFLSNDSSSMEI